MPLPLLEIGGHKSGRHFFIIPGNFRETTLAQAQTPIKEHSAMSADNKNQNSGSTSSTKTPLIFREAIDKGLEGIVACSTAISSIVGDTLQYRGYTIDDLYNKTTFEEVVLLLWKGTLPATAELTGFRDRLWQEQILSDAEIKWVTQVAQQSSVGVHPMDFLRTAVSGLAFFDSDIVDIGPEATERKAMRLCGRMGTLVGNFHRIRSGKTFLQADPKKSIAWNFLRMVLDKDPKPEHVTVFDKCLILHADHEINCSTFTARVTTSSLSDIHSAIVSAIGALRGPLHGGANEQVIKMLQAIGSLDKTVAFIDEALAGKKKIMGIGHRVYKNGDPRARLLKGLSEKLTLEIGKPELFQMSVLIDDTLQAKKGLMPNVDFYSATVYFALGIPTDLFTPVFAVSRIAGWAAHIMEQYKNNRIYRPRGEYVGPRDQKITR